MTRTVPAVERCLDILDLFLDGWDRLTPPLVVEKLGLPRTSVHELLTTLAGRGLIERDSDEPGSFRPGLKLFRLGAAYADQIDLVDVSRSVGKRVSQECDETIHVGVLDGVHVIYIAKVDSSRQFRMVSAEGRRLPASCTAVGKALLAHADADEIAEHYGHDELPQMTDRSVTSWPQLRRELDRVGRDGLAHEECESNPDVCCVAAPIRDRDGVVVAAMSISVPKYRWDRRRRAELGDLVRRAAAEVSDRLGAPAPQQGSP
jgi:IclR family transcriptional regulator, KDG regulon repressor